MDPLQSHKTSTSDGTLPQEWTVYGLADAVNAPAQKPPWRIEAILPAESAVLASGHPHALKSFSWLEAALEAAAGKKVWGHFESSVESSLFVETEDPRWMIDGRIRSLAEGLNIKPEDAPGFHYACIGPFDLVKSEELLCALLEKHRPGFMVLSTLQNLLNGRDWKEQSDMQAVNALIIKLSRQYCPIVLITHSPWNPREKRAAGTITQAANFLTTMHFEKRFDRKTRETFARVTLDSKIGATETDFSLRVSVEEGEVRGIAYHCTGLPKGSGRDVVLEAIQQDPSASTAEIAERAGISTRYVQKLMKEGRAKKDG
jgi:hypothetical protein